jgi:predicted kinase
MTPLCASRAATRRSSLTRKADMQTVTLTRGLPASGKTTAALKLVADSGGRTRRVNLDALRLMLDDNDGSVRNTREHEEVVLQVQDAAILAAVDAGFDAVLDNTHLVPRLPNRYKKLLATRDITFAVADFTDVPVEECIRRDAARDRPVGEALIRDMAKRLNAGRGITAERLNADRTPVAVEPSRPNWSLPAAVLCDIDGTLALHAGLRGPYDMEQCESDLVNGPVASALAVYANTGDQVILLSGRQEEVRPHTERWLAAHGIRYDELWMRPAGDRRGDDIVKAELFDAHVRHRFAVRHVWDDRDRVVALWRRMGLSCWQVAYGNF